MYAKRSFPTVLKDIVLFLASPVIALSYLALFPYFAVTMLRQFLKDKRAARAAN